MRFRTSTKVCKNRAGRNPGKGERMDYKKETRIRDAEAFAEQIVYVLIDGGFIKSTEDEAVEFARGVICDMIYERDEKRRKGWHENMVSAIHDEMRRVDPVE
jgi:hypothetical protein